VGGLAYGGKAFASPEFNSRAIAGALQAAFGSRAMLDGGKLHIMPDPQATMAELVYRATANEQASGSFAFIKSAQRNALAEAAGAEIPAGATIDIDASHISHILKKHGDDVGTVNVTDVMSLPEIMAKAQPRATTLRDLQKPTAGDVTWEHPDGYVVGTHWSRKAHRCLVTTLYRKGLKK